MEPFGGRPLGTHADDAPRKHSASRNSLIAPVSQGLCVSDGTGNCPDSAPVDRTICTYAKRNSPTRPRS